MFAKRILQDTIERGRDMTKNIPILSSIYLFTIFLLIVDVYKSGTTVFKYTHISSFIYGYIACVIIVLARLYARRTISIALSRLNTYLVFPCTFVSGAILTILGYVTPPNFIYSFIPLQISQIILLSMFSGVVTLVGQTNAWYEKYYRQIVFGSGAAIFCYALIASLLPFDVFAELSKEDHVIEYLQVVMLTVSAIYFFLFAKRLYEGRKLVLGIVFLFAAIVLAMVVGDEVSWGQRILHIATPSCMLESNVQQEITVHNLDSVGSDKVNLGYILIGMYGLLSWVFQYMRAILKKYPLSLFVTPWFASIYFFLGFIFNLYIRLDSTHTISVWAEFVEFMLYSGIMIYIVYMYYAYDEQQNEKN